VDVENRVQLDAVRRHARLAVDEVEEADAGDPHRNVGRLERRGGRELRVEFAAGDADAGGERARRGNSRRAGRDDAGRRRNLRDDRVAVVVLDDDVVVDVAFLLV